MTDIKNVKNRVIFTLIAVVLVMVTAVLVLAYNNDYSLKPKEGSWNVEFTSIAEGEKTGGAISRKKPYHTGTYASFFVDFISPGDSMVYDMQVSNKGNLDAMLDDIIYIKNTYEDAIKYEVIGINEGDVLKAGASKNFQVKVSYILNSNIAVTFEAPISITFNYVQYIK